MLQELWSETVIKVSSMQCTSVMKMVQIYLQKHYFTKGPLCISAVSKSIKYFFQSYHLACSSIQCFPYNPICLVFKKCTMHKQFLFAKKSGMQTDWKQKLTLVTYPLSQTTFNFIFFSDVRVDVIAHSVFQIAFSKH